MRQYTTPTITCHISPADILSGATGVTIIIAQDATGVKITAPGNTDSDAGTVSYTLTQEESASFAVGPALVQVTGKTGAKYWASDIAKVIVKRNLALGGDTE